MHLTLSFALAVLATAFAPAPAPPDTTWPQFRGHAGRAVSTMPASPTTWSTSMNVAWSVDVPGRAWSSPIVWGDQVIVTSAVGTRPFKQPSPGIFGNDYVAELQKQGLSEAQIMEKLRAREQPSMVACRIICNALIIKRLCNIA